MRPQKRDSNPASAPSSQASVLEWPKGSICAGRGGGWALGCGARAEGGGRGGGGRRAGCGRARARARGGRGHLPRAARRGLGPKVLEDELVAARRLVDHRRQERARLVVHAPAPVDELELLVFHQGFGSTSLKVIGLLPPPGEKRRLHIYKLSVGILRELLRQRIDDPVDLSRKILIYGHLPARVVVRMRDEVDVDLAFDGAALRVIYSVWRRRVGRCCGAIARRPERVRGRAVA